MEVQVSKRRSFTPEFKAEIVLSVLSGQRSAMDLVREHQLKPQQISEWKAEFVANVALVFRRDSETDATLARLVELERLVGQLTPELEAAKKASRLLNAPARRNGWSS
jgi:transposase